MYRNAFTLLALCALALPAQAGQGVLFSFTLTEQHSESDQTESTFGFLVDYGKESFADIGNTAKLIVTPADEPDAAQLTLTLLDYTRDGELVLVGKDDLRAPYNTTSQIAWHPPSGTHYILHVVPKRAKTP
ncbi:MAG: hypothetical protein AAF662_07895 [Pseudomonadota bacterium]